MCVRVTDMRGVDLERFRFDYDLTFAAMLMHPDGHVYHRYGGRDWNDPNRWLSIESLAAVLEDTLDEHVEYSNNPSPPPPHKARALEQVPAFARKDKGECLHCHMVFPALYEDGVERGSWQPEDIWIHPTPDRVGLEVGRDDQSKIRSVRSGSPADAAGLRGGDRLLSMGAQRILTASDVQWVLHNLPAAGAEVALEYERDGQSHSAALELAEDWKREDPLSFSWRPFKWEREPMPGFGGSQLEADELARAGLEAGSFAFRVDYIVTWNENKRFGNSAKRAGIRKGDLFLSAAGKSDFESVDHFHAWWRLTRKVGEQVEVVVLKKRKRETLRLPVLR